MSTWLPDMEKSNPALANAYKSVGNQDKTSFIVNMRDKQSIKYLIAEQESILELSEIQPNGLRKAKLVFKDGTETNLGDMTQVTEIKAKASNAYTFDGQSYFVAG